MQVYQDADSLHGKKSFLNQKKNILLFFHPSDFCKACDFSETHRFISNQATVTKELHATESWGWDGAAD